MRAQRVQLGGLKISRRLLKIMVDIVSDSEIPVFRFIADLMVEQFSFERPFKIGICERDGWYLALMLEKGYIHELKKCLFYSSEFVSKLVWDCLN